jgi:DNA polymerase III alpha subunit
MAFVTVETLAGPCEVTVFSDIFEQRAGLLVPDMIVMIPARVNYRNNEAGLVASDVIPIEEAEKHLTKAVHIRLSTVGLDEPLLQRLAGILDVRPGRCDVYLHCYTPEHKEVTIHATSACRVAASEALRKDVEDLLGEETVWFSAGNALPKHDREP